MSKIKEAKDYIVEHKDELITGAICGAIGFGSVMLGYKLGVNNSVYAVHAGVKKDPERFVKLAQIGISKYNGKNLKRLEKAGEAIEKVFEQYGV